MDREEILSRVAPCVLLCHTCSAFSEGVICTCSKTLLHYLDGLKGFYRRHLPDAVAAYSAFEEVLARYAAGPCPGCRSGGRSGCCISGCFLPECCKSHGVDFCGECSAFPCEKAASLFEGEVYAQWLDGGKQIGEKGAEAFWEENSQKPHYRPYGK